MTVMLLEDFLTSLNVQTEDAYLVAVTSSDMLVGSSCLADTCLVGNNQQLTIWGDDSFSPELDGAIDGEIITINLIDGSDVYDLAYSLAFQANGMLLISTAVSPQLICKTEGPLGLYQFRSL